MNVPRYLLTGAGLLIMALCGVSSTLTGAPETNRDAQNMVNILDLTGRYGFYYLIAPADGNPATPDLEVTTDRVSIAGYGTIIVLAVTPNNDRVYFLKGDHVEVTAGTTTRDLDDPNEFTVATGSGGSVSLTPIRSITTTHDFYEMIKQMVVRAQNEDPLPMDYPADDLWGTE